MSRHRTAGAWAGKRVRICPTATTATGQPHPYAGALGTVLNLPPAGNSYSVRLDGGHIVNASLGVLVLADGTSLPSGPIGAWPHRGTERQPLQAPLHTPVTNATSRAPLQAAALHPMVRPGADDATLLPSRRGSRLHYRCGRVTDLQGNPITQE